MRLTHVRAEHSPADARSLAPGRPLEPAVRRGYEAYFGHDLSQVRVHADTVAAESAEALGADAYTAGPHVVFGAGKYAPDTQAGRRVLAHELAHVVQQRAAAVADPLALAACQLRHRTVPPSVPPTGRPTREQATRGRARSRSASPRRPSTARPNRTPRSISTWAGSTSRVAACKRTASWPRSPGWP